MFEIKIETSGAAFGEDFYETSCEIRRILEKIIEEMDAGKKRGIILDINGNRVGKWGEE